MKEQTQYVSHSDRKPWSQHSTNITFEYLITCVFVCLLGPQEVKKQDNSHI